MKNRKYKEKWEKKKKRNKKPKHQKTKEKLSTKNEVFLNTTYQNRKNNTNKWIQIEDTNIKPTMNAIQK